MTNKMLVLDIQNHYPFGQNPHKGEPRIQILTRKTLPLNSEPRFILKQKIKLLKNMDSQHLVALQSVAEEENCTHLMFEYVGTGLGAVMAKFSVRQLETLIAQLNQLAEKLVNLSVSHTLKLGNIGLDPQNNLKYFLGLDFRIDRSLNKTDALKKYKSQIEALLRVSGQSGARRRSVKEQGSNLLLVPVRAGEQSFLKYQPGKVLMKKSSTQAERKSECELNKNQQHRLTFDINSQMRVQVKGGQGELKTEIKVVKMEELGQRISKLKNYMKEVAGKTTSVRATTAKTDENAADNREGRTVPGLNKLEQKIAEFRESRLLRSYKEKEMPTVHSKQGYELSATHGMQPIDRSLKEIKQRRSNLLGSLKKEDRSMSPQREPPTPTHESGRAHWNFNNYGLHQDERKTKQYKKLAESDKYCEEFMYFLEDDQPAANHRHKTTKTVHVADNRHSPGKGIERNVSPEGRMKGLLEHMEHMATESSEKGALQLQARVKNVIRHSIKLINNLKGKQLLCGE